MELTAERDSAEGRARALDHMLETWVPKEELNKLAHAHFQLKTRYSALLAEHGEQSVSKETVRECLKDRARLEERVKELTVSPWAFLLA